MWWTVSYSAHRCSTGSIKMKRITLCGLANHKEREIFALARGEGKKDRGSTPETKAPEMIIFYAVASGSIFRPRKGPYMFRPFGAGEGRPPRAGVVVSGNETRSDMPHFLPPQLLPQPALSTHGCLAPPATSAARIYFQFLFFYAHGTRALART